MKKIKFTELLIFIISAELTGAFSSILSGGSFNLYQELIQPTLSPPGWIFPIVWGILYALMGISAYLIFTSNAESRKKSHALKLYTAQLLVNFIWSIVFFRFKILSLSVAVILLLFVLVSAMFMVFRKIRPAAGYINLPYLLWTAFAAYLNIGILILN